MLCKLKNKFFHVQKNEMYGYFFNLINFYRRKNFQLGLLFSYNVINILVIKVMKLLFITNN